MTKFFTSILLLFLLSVGGMVAYEQFVPIDKYVKYYAVVAEAWYKRTSSLRFLSLAENPEELRHIEWRDALMCRFDGINFEEQAVYESSIDGRKATLLDPILKEHALKRPPGDFSSTITLWSAEAFKLAGEVNKSTWSFQLNMDWPDRTIPCFGRHKITIHTPIFGLVRSVEIDSSAFWLIADGETVGIAPAPNEIDD